MKEQITGFLLKCDVCGEYLEVGAGGAMVFLHEDEIALTCEAYDWIIIGQTHYCDNCKNDGHGTE